MNDGFVVGPGVRVYVVGYAINGAGVEVKNEVPILTIDTLDSFNRMVEAVRKGALEACRIASGPNDGSVRLMTSEEIDDYERYLRGE